jgi:hypothetical protein
MRALTPHEKRTMRVGFGLLLIYLVLFYGVRGWRQLENRRAEYQRLVEKARQLRAELQPYETKALKVQKLRETYQIQPALLSKATLVAEASAAIQKAATAGGVQLGPVRESSARGSNKELVSMQLEGTGPVSAVMSLLYRLQTLGFPIILDSVQLTSDSAKPSVLKMTVTIVILDYEEWKTPEGGHA